MWCDEEHDAMAETAETETPDNAPPPEAEESLQAFRERMATEDPNAEPSEAPTAEAATEEATADADATPASERLIDPDTGDVLDRRTRTSRRIQALLRDRSERDKHIRLLEANATKTPARKGAKAHPNGRRTSQAQASAAPRLEDFQHHEDPYAAHQRASQDYHLDRKLDQRLNERDDQRATVERTHRTQSAIEAAQKRWDDGLDTARKQHPDFDAAYDALYSRLESASGDERTRFVTQALMTSPAGHALAHHLGTHQDALAALYQTRSLDELNRAIGRLEARFEGETPQTASRQNSNQNRALPAPVDPVASGATATSYNAETATLAQYRAKHGLRGGRPTRGS
jgi:hypothetical protein